jgi:energy-coupling factor transporter ATP-binding protein EcfA2
MGSGLTQFILVLANVLIKMPSYVLIDEPELGLHPKLQLDFLTSLGKFSKSGVWFTTHNIGLARSSSQRVYSVSRLSDGNSIVKLLEGTPRLGEFLGEMSFSNQSEVGFDKILLVEGSTDVPVFQQYLRLLGKDRSVLTLPLSGNINGGMAEQLQEIKRISGYIYIVIDSEKNSESDVIDKSRNEFLEICTKLDIKVYILKLRSTENYFPDHIVKETFGNNYNSLKSYESLSKSNTPWNKSQNFKLASKMTLEALEKTDFWEFLKML